MNELKVLGMARVVQTTIFNSNNYYTNILPPESILNFITSDDTPSHEYSLEFDCAEYAISMKNNANKQGIRCECMVLMLRDASNNETGHAICVFPLNDERTQQLYVDPQDPLYDKNNGKVAKSVVLTRRPMVGDNYSRLLVESLYLSKAVTELLIQSLPKQTIYDFLEFYC